MSTVGREDEARLSERTDVMLHEQSMSGRLDWITGLSPSSERRQLDGEAAETRRIKTEQLDLGGWEVGTLEACREGTEVGRIKNDRTMKGLSFPVAREEEEAEEAKGKVLGTKWREPVDLVKTQGS